MHRWNLVLVATFVSQACVTQRATTMATPKELVTHCQKVCTDVGMEMTAMVVIMNSSGCVCEFKKSGSASPTAAGAGAASGGAIIAAAAAAQAAQAAAEQQRQQQAARR